MTGVKNKAILITTTEELLDLREKIAHELLEKSKLHGCHERQTIGLVPTMGNLHEGHLTLLREALKKHDYIFISIFVNPKQFGPQEDFDRYPRTLIQDELLINKTISINTNSTISEFVGSSFFKDTSIVIIFAPQSVQEIFPLDFDTEVAVNSLTKIMCGKSRPHHFQGVTTVVYRLFALIRPTAAYFGQKDYQQVQVVKRMVSDLLIPVKIVEVPIIRDEDGLALSSRNNFLSKEERALALTLPRTLQKIQKILQKRVENSTTGAVTSATAITMALNFIQEIISKDTNWDYLEIRDADNLLANISGESKRLVIAGAYRVGCTRLIDNIVLN